MHVGVPGDRWIAIGKLDASPPTRLEDPRRAAIYQTITIRSIAYPLYTRDIHTHRSNATHQDVGFIAID